MVKYGLFTCLGRKAIFSPGLICPFGLAEPCAAGPCELLSVELLVVPPQAASAMTMTAAPATAAARRRPDLESRPDVESREVMAAAFPWKVYGSAPRSGFVGPRPLSAGPPVARAQR